MWVIANGTPKAGSTWLVQLLEVTGRFEPVPAELQADGWRNPSVRDSAVRSAASSLPLAEARYLSKQHWAESNTDLLALPGIKVLNIVRDVRGVVISRYHHNVRVAGERLSLEEFVFKKGRKYVRDYCAYHRHWISAPSVSRENYFVSSYESLSFDLVSAAEALYAFVGLEPDEGEAGRYAGKTAFSRKRTTGPGRFFRRGRAMAHQDEIDEEASLHLLRCARESGLPQIKEEIHNHAPALAEYLRMTDVGLEAADR